MKGTRPFSGVIDIGIQLVPEIQPRQKKISKKRFKLPVCPMTINNNTHSHSMEIVYLSVFHVNFPVERTKDRVVISI